ncbi:mechanosensitive ion channel family protein [Alicyclobacillaceae bacterium I2511]|nr:mechanosensitive ion channel family protein [Alicyclobacillaceae bacterium I2511]
MHPWRRMLIILLLLIASAAVFSVAKDSSVLNFLPVKDRFSIQWGLVLLWAMIGVWLIRQLRHVVLRIASKSSKLDVRVGLLLSRALSAVGYAFVLVVALHLLQIKIGSILVGGALTGVIVGIAAQSTLSNLFAGVLLFTLRPFSIGNFVTLRTWMFSGIEYSGTVIDINWYYTVLMDGTQKRILPNSSILISAITIIADTGIQLYTLPLPYTVSAHNFEQALQQAVAGPATVLVREFGEDTYTVQVRVPTHVDRDVIRATLLQLRTQSNVSGEAANAVDTGSAPATDLPSPS